MIFASHATSKQRIFSLFFESKTTYILRHDVCIINNLQLDFWSPERHEDGDPAPSLSHEGYPMKHRPHAAGRSHTRLALFTAPVLLASLGVFTACSTSLNNYDSADLLPGSDHLHPQGASGYGGGGNNWGGGGNEWSGGGNDWGGGGNGWGGGGNWWGGGGNDWSGGGNDWGGGGNDWSGGLGQWSGGGNDWGGGGNDWGGGLKWWSGGGNDWGGGGNGWGGGGNDWGGGGNDWSGAGGLATGGFTTTYPFLGVTASRTGKVQGIPQPGYTPGAFAKVTAPQDTTACAAGQARLGGFAYPIDVDGWQGYVTLGYSKALCLPTPGSTGLTMNPTVGNATLSNATSGAGGYTLATNSRTRPRICSPSRAWWATPRPTWRPKGAATCARPLGLSRRANGAAASALPTRAPTTFQAAYGTNGLTPRGVVVSAAQGGVNPVNNPIPFGYNDGFGVYALTKNDMQSYAQHVLPKYNQASLTGTGNKPGAIPTNADAIAAWNGSAQNASMSFTGTDFTSFAPWGAASSATLLPILQRSVGIVNATSGLNMVPRDPTGSNGILASDLNNGLQQNPGDLYPLNLHSLSTTMSPLYGSGGARWFFHDSTDANALNKPLLDLSAIYQGTMNVLTGQLRGAATNATLASPYIAPLSFLYADWHNEPAPGAGTLYIDRAGQNPPTLASDTDRENRLNVALSLAAPPRNMAGATWMSCGINSAKGSVMCWGRGFETANFTPGPPTPTGIASGALAIAVAASGYYNNATSRCAVVDSGGVTCTGSNGYGQLGNGTTTDVVISSSSSVLGLTANDPLVRIAAGHDNVSTGGTFCALHQSGTIQCWGSNSVGQLGIGTTSSSPALQAGTAVSGIANAIDIAGAQGHFCALLANGTVKCWGEPTRGARAQRQRHGAPILGHPRGRLRLVERQDAECRLRQRLRHRPRGKPLGLGRQREGRDWQQHAHRRVGTREGPLGGGRRGRRAVAHVRALDQRPGSLLGRRDQRPTRQRPRVRGTNPRHGRLGHLERGLAHRGIYYTCVRLADGSARCWGDNLDGQLGNFDGTAFQPTPNSPSSCGNSVAICQGNMLNSNVGYADPYWSVPVTVQGGATAFNDSGLMASQGSVLATMDPSGKFGHITPIPYSMTNSSGQQSLLVTYNPLAVFAAQFIEMYKPHLAACNATTTADAATMTYLDQLSGRKLWACTNPTFKNWYTGANTGLAERLAAAKLYLFGQSDGCVQDTSGACPVTKITYANAHLPYTVVVPSYTAINSGYATSVSNAISTRTTRRSRTRRRSARASSAPCNWSARPRSPRTTRSSRRASRVPAATGPTAT